MARKTCQICLLWAFLNRWVNAKKGRRSKRKAFLIGVVSRWALGLHFILCPFPNQFQFGLGKKSKFWRLVFQTNSSLVWKKWPHFGSKKFQTNNNMDKGIMVSSVCHWLFLFETLLMWLYSMSRLTGRCTMRARMSARGSARCCIERWSWCLWSTWRQYRLLGVIEMVTGRCARLAWGGCGGCWWVVTKE